MGGLLGGQGRRDWSLPAGSRLRAGAVRAPSTRAGSSPRGGPGRGHAASQGCLWVGGGAR
eukprot:14796894-Alexandrium_andersonii.AAC.1